MPPHVGVASALRRTAEFYLDVFLGLLAGYIFAVCLAGGVYDPVTTAPKWHLQWQSLLANPVLAPLTTLFQDANVIGMWKTFGPVERLLLFLLGMNILRLAHSFFLLQRDDDYLIIFESSNPSNRPFILAVVQIILQAFTVIFTLFAIVTFGDKFAYMFGWFAFLIVAAYDALTLWACKDVACPRLQKAFKNWWKLDKFIIVGGMVVVVVVVIYEAAGTIPPSQPLLLKILEFPSAIGLFLMWALDYLVFNREFYLTPVAFRKP